MIVTIKKRDSVFPIGASFTLNKIRYSLVFESKEQCESYFKNRFYPKKITYKEVTK